MSHSSRPRSSTRCHPEATPRIPAIDRWGIADGYRDARESWQVTSPTTRAALRAAMGVAESEAREEPDEDMSVRIVRPGDQCLLPEPAELTLEDGSTLRLEGGALPELPIGYHLLRGADTPGTVRLIVSPGHCMVPPVPGWGWAAQLYATRSAASWGIGDFGDLQQLGRWAAGLGARFLLVNPLGASTPVGLQSPSPYTPSSRSFVNLLYLRIEDVPGADALGPDLEALASTGRSLNATRAIDRDSVFRLKREALERLWRRFPGDRRFDEYRYQQGAALTAFATFSALAETHGAAWRLWPAEYRHAEAAAVTDFAADHRDRVAFHAWTQWLLDAQLARASAEIPVIQDLPIGVDPDGADAWLWQDQLALEATVGAPPDLYNPGGQDWRLPPFVPHKLRAVGYTPFIQTLRRMLRHAGGLRIDHVMGLFRLYWIPAGQSAAAGAYVHYHAEELLAILAIESQRAGAVVIGEDLGTVPDDVPPRLQAHGVLSYRVLWFGPEGPLDYPERSLAAVTTHDLPTIAGVWTGADIARQRALGLDPGEAHTLHDRLIALTGLPAAAGLEEVIVEAHRVLARSRSVWVAATLEDALALDERPNMPGAGSGHHNWSLALPMPRDELERHPRALAIARALGERRSPAGGEGAAAGGEGDLIR